MTMRFARLGGVLFGGRTTILALQEHVLAILLADETVAGAMEGRCVGESKSKRHPRSWKEPDDGAAVTASHRPVAAESLPLSPRIMSRDLTHLVLLKFTWCNFRRRQRRPRPGADWRASTTMTVDAASHRIIDRVCANARTTN